MPEQRHVTVVGGGVVGLATALRLLRDGHDVRVISDRAPSETTAAGSGGMFCITNVVPLGTREAIRGTVRNVFSYSGPVTIPVTYLPRLFPWLRRMVAASSSREAERIACALSELLSRSMQAYRPLIERTGAEALVRRAGYLALYDTPSARDADAYWLQRRRDFGLSVDALDRDELRQLEPALPDGLSAIYYPEGGHVLDLPAFLEGLAAATVRDGARFVRDSIVDVELKQGTPHRLVGKVGSYQVDQLVVAAGAWSKPLAERLGTWTPLDTERGYNVTYEIDGEVLRRPVIFANRKFGVVPMNGAIRVAGTIEFAGLERPPTGARYKLLRANAEPLFPQLEPGRATEWMGFRPTLPDWLPALGRSVVHPNVIYAFGHQHIGLTSAAITGDIVADLVARRTPAFDITPMRPDRFN